MSIDKKNPSFDIITQSNILTEGVIRGLQEMAPELKEVFLKAQVFRTRTEMEISVLNNTKHPTPASKYWQSVREQNVMFSELVMLSYEYRKNLVEIKILERKLKGETDDLERELLQIEIEKKTFFARNQEKTAKARIIELKNWSEIKDREAKQMSKAELEEVDNHQLISYTKRWIKQSIFMGPNGSPAERQNLLGQLNSGITLCIQKGIIKSVLAGLKENIREKIKLEYNLK